jgi:uncharacterized protein (UPF0212 family)
VFADYITVSPPKPKYEVADVFRYFIEEYRERHKVSMRQEEVIRAVMSCRTAEMGGVINRCEECGAVQFVFKSCGDVHCPKCGKFHKAEWVVRQEIVRLPVPYFHVTFTTDHAINALFPANQEVVLEALFWAVSETIKEFGEEELGGQVGFTAVLHTWGQTMNEHVHIHCIVPGVALSKEGRVRLSGGGYLFDAVKLSARYRDRFCRKIGRLYRQGKLKPVGEADVEEMVREMQAKDWEVFIKGFEKVEKLYEYLSRYVHQVAISNGRITGINRREKTVSFRYKDNKGGGQEKEMTLEAGEFIRRFLWHVLPGGFWRIRHYGLHHGSCRKKLSQVRALLGLAAAVPEVEKLSLREWLEGLLGEDRLNKCPQCGQQTMSRQGEYETFSTLQLLLLNLFSLMRARQERVAAV